jgi:hypothetical protein
MSNRLDHAAATGAFLATLGALLGGLDWATRPACPERYVRLIDVEPTAAVLCGLFAAALLWRAGRTASWCRRRKDVTGVTVAVSVALTLVAVVPTLVAVGMLVQHHGQQPYGDCWTF